MATHPSTPTKDAVQDITKKLTDSALRDNAEEIVTSGLSLNGQVPSLIGGFVSSSNLTEIADIDPINATGFHISLSATNFSSVRAEDVLYAQVEKGDFSEHEEKVYHLRDKYALRIMKDPYWDNATGKPLVVAYITREENAGLAQFADRVSQSGLCVAATFQFGRVKNPYPESKGCNKMLLPGAIKIHTAKIRGRKWRRYLAKNDNLGLDSAFSFSFLIFDNLAALFAGFSNFYWRRRGSIPSTTNTWPRKVNNFVGSSWTKGKEVRW